MRLALVIGSSCEKNGKLTALPSAELDGDLIERRLSEPDAGFTVARFAAERGLAEHVEQWLMAVTEPIEQLLVYFSGYSVLSAERGPALLLDGDRLGTFSLSRLKSLFARFAESACLIVDAAAVVDAGQSLQAVVDGIGATLTQDTPKISALVSVRNSDVSDPFGGSAFTGVVLMVLDWLATSRDDTQAVDIRWLFEGLRADEQLWSEVPAAGLFAGEGQAFVVLPPRPQATARKPLPGFDSSRPDTELDELLGIPSASSSSPRESSSALSAAVSSGEPLPSFADLSADDQRLDTLSAEAPLPAFAFPATGDNDAVASTVPARRSPSLAAFEAASHATELAAGGRYAEAAVEFEAALTSIRNEGERASVLARFARVLARLGRAEAAATRFAEALELDPLNLDVLKVRAEWAAIAGDGRNLLHTAEAWLGTIPDDTAALVYLAEAAERLGDSRRALDAHRRLARHAELGAEQRISALAEAARIASTHLGDAELAQRLSIEAQELRASLPGAAPAGPNELFARYEQALEQTNDPETIERVSTELERLAGELLGDPLKAAPVLERLVTRLPNDLILRERLIELYLSGADPTRALGHCRIAARLSPTHPGTYRRAQALFEAAKSSDGAWNAASVLECLGEADINEALLASQHRPEGLLAVQSTFSENDFVTLLFSENHDTALGRLLLALDTCAVRVGIGFAKHKGRYVVPDSATLQEPDKSTTMLAKTLAWSARLLGLPPPSVYVVGELERVLDVAPTEQASALASRALGSGLSLGQLAFLWGRHLPRFHPELRGLSFFQSPIELAELITAALALGEAPGASVRTLDGDAKRLYAALRRDLRGPALERLRSAAQAFSLRETSARADDALRELELVGVRAGLVCCGDVAVAAELIGRFPVQGVTQPSEQLGELYAFAISEQYAAIRQKIGVAVAA